MNNLVVKHDADKHLFYAKVKGGNAELRYEPHGDKYLDYKETYVPEASRKFGVASTIVEKALDFAMKQDLKVKPSCPFVRSYLQKSEKYDKIAF